MMPKQLNLSSLQFLSHCSPAVAKLGSANNGKFCNCVLAMTMPVMIGIITRREDE